MKLKKVLTIPLSHCCQLLDVLQKDISKARPIKMKDAYVIRRIDGKFYRGQKLWKWSHSVHNAAFLEKDFWEMFITWEFDKKGIIYDLIKVTDIEV